MRLRRTLIAALILASASVVAFANDMSNSSWSETDASNNATPPNGWPAGMNPSQVEPAARAMMGALKRWYNHVNATATSSGTNTITLTYSVAPAAYVTGDLYTFIAGGTNTGAATININSLGAKAIQLNGAALTGGEITSGGLTVLAYDGTQFQLANYGITFGSSFTKSGGAVSLNPSAASTLGGVKSLSCSSHNWFSDLSTSGVFTCSQPAASDVSGLATSATTDTTNASNISSGTLAAARLPSNAILIGVREFTSSQTYTPTSGTNEVVVMGCGAGGAGGGAKGTTSGQAGVGGGGGAGGGFIGYYTSGFSGVSLAIGAAGTAGSAGQNGNAGGNTGFGATAIATGGSGGGAGTSAAITWGSSGAGGSTSGTTINAISGGPGQFTIARSADAVSQSGAGGDAPYGLGFGGVPVIAGTSVNGNAGTGFCSGGSGGANAPSQLGNVGGAGGPGVIIIWEYR